MYEGIGRSLGTDYFRIADQLTREERDYLRRTRDFVDDEVLPVINGYWERAEFPWPLIKQLGKLGIVGDGIQGYGCPPMSPIAAGLVTWSSTAATAAWAPSSGCRPGWRCSRSPCSAPRSRSSAGCPPWRAGEAGRVRADRADPRLGLGRVGDLGPPRRRRAGSSTARRSGSATAPSPTSSSSGPATPPTSRSRASWSRRARPGTTPNASTARARCARCGRPRSP